MYVCVCVCVCVCVSLCVSLCVCVCVGCYVVLMLFSCFHCVPGLEGFAELTEVHEQQVETCRQAICSVMSNNWDAQLCSLVYHLSTDDLMS